MHSRASICYAYYMNITTAAKTLGKRGASSGGYARAISLTSERRSEIARMAAQARWCADGEGDAVEFPSQSPSAIRQHGDSCGDPQCPCHRFRKHLPERGPNICTLGKPLWMVIPPEGIHIQCPVHGQHFIPGSPFVWF